MIKNLCNPIISVLVSIFLNEVLYVYYQTAELLKTCQKKFLIIAGHNKLFDGPHPAVMRKKVPKINIIGCFSWRMAFKKFSDKILLDNNVTYLLGFFFQNMCIIWG